MPGGVPGLVTGPLLPLPPQAGIQTVANSAKSSAANKPCRARTVRPGRRLRTRAALASPAANASQPTGILNGGSDGGSRRRGTAIPGAVVATLTATLLAELPLIVTLPGESAQVASEGAPAQVSEMVPLNPPTDATLKL